jgi:exosortase
VSTSDRRSARVTLALAGITALTWVLLYRDVIVRLVDAWHRDQNYSHGFLVAPLSAYLVWQRRGDLRGTGSLVGVAGMLVSFAMLVAGDLGAELFVTRVSMLLMLASIAVLLAGWRSLARLTLPLGLLLLAIPVPAIIFNQVAFPLQLLASHAGEATLQLFHIPVLREGNVIVLSTATLEVAEACSGIRSLMSLASLAVVYGHFTHESPAARTMLALASVPIAIFANAARVAGTGTAAHFYGPAAAEGFLHTFSGWLMFVAAFGMLLAFDALIVKPLIGRRRSAAATPPAESVLA